MVVEAAGHDALMAYGHAVLTARRHLYIVSVGALAQGDLRDRLLVAAKEAGSAIHIPCGALAGFDGLMALRCGGLEGVRYTSIKPPAAWVGTPAEGLLGDLSAGEARTVFEGPAGQAAASFPKNANLAAAVALAGIGFEQTQIRLIADSSATVNSGVLEAWGPQGHLRVEVAGRAEPDNPKSSAIVADSIVASLRNARGALRFV